MFRQLGQNLTNMSPRVHPTKPRGFANRDQNLQYLPPWVHLAKRKNHIVLQTRIKNLQYLPPWVHLAKGKNHVVLPTMGQKLSKSTSGVSKIRRARDIFAFLSKYDQNFVCRKPGDACNGDGRQSCDEGEFCRSGQCQAVALKVLFSPCSHISYLV
jgi:hypothetical protein